MRRVTRPCTPPQRSLGRACPPVVWSLRLRHNNHHHPVFQRPMSSSAMAAAQPLADLPRGSRPPPGAVGDDLAHVRTPALLVDREALLHNLKRLPAMLPPPAQQRVRIRAHFKAHKCGAIARLQLQEGRADGFCFQKVSEVEGLLRYFDDHDQADGRNVHSSTEDASKDLLDLMVTNEVVDRANLRRLCELTHHPRVKRMGVAVDDLGVLEVLLAEAKATGARDLGVLLEVDVGQQRCGVDVESAEGRDGFVRLARRLMEAHRDTNGHVRFTGLQAYHGANQHVRAAADRERTVQHVASLVRCAVDLLKENDCLPEGEFLISGGGTGSFLYEVRSGIYNEIQPGSYALMDRDYSLNLNEENKLDSTFKHSLFILSTVISTAGAARGWVTLDVGHKGYAVDSGAPVVWNNDELECVCAGDEHTKLVPRKEGDLAALAKFKVGDRVWLVPGHCDPTCNLYDWILAVHENKVVDVWAVSARGPGL